MTADEQRIVKRLIEEAWDDGFELCRFAAVAICAAHGQVKLAEVLQKLPIPQVRNP